nr:hypothetical protein BAU18_02905 [Enterococcus diestrammenae]
MPTLTPMRMPTPMPMLMRMPTRTPMENGRRYQELAELELAQVPVQAQELDQERAQVVQHLLDQEASRSYLKLDQWSIQHMVQLGLELF